MLVKRDQRSKKNIIVGEMKNLKFPLHYAIEVAIDNSSWFCSHFSGMRTHLRHCERRLCINLPRGIIFNDRHEFIEVACHYTGARAFLRLSLAYLTAEDNAVTLQAAVFFYSKIIFPLYFNTSSPSTIKAKVKSYIKSKMWRLVDWKLTNAILHPPIRYSQR